MAREAFAVSERFRCPGDRAPDHPHLPRQGPRRRASANPRARRLCQGSAALGHGARHAKPRVALMYERGPCAPPPRRAPFNLLVEGSDRRIGFVTSGPGLHACARDLPRRAGVQARPVPPAAARACASSCRRRRPAPGGGRGDRAPGREGAAAGGIACTGQGRLLPRVGELARRACARRWPSCAARKSRCRAAPPGAAAGLPAFRPPCASPVRTWAFYYTLAQLRKTSPSPGDIGCHTLGAGHPWNALDTHLHGRLDGRGLGMDKDAARPTPRKR